MHLLGQMKKSSIFTPIYVNAESIEDTHGFWEKFKMSLDEAELKYVEDDNPLHAMEKTLRGFKFPVILINEVDGMALKADGLLKLLRSLSEDGICQTVMVGYHGAYGATQNGENPLFNWTSGIGEDKAIILGQLSKIAALKLIDMLETSKLSLHWENEETRATGREILWNVPTESPFFCNELAIIW